MPEPGNNTRSDEPGSSLASAAFEHYAEGLHRFLVRRLTRTQDASDLMQEIFLRLLRLKRGELIRNPQAYLFGIASRVVREYRNQSRGTLIVFDSDLVSQRSEHPESISPGAFADGIGIGRQLEQALELLPPLQSQIFLLERCEGLSHAQIAAKLGLSVHTVKKYAVQALAFLRHNCCGDGLRE